MSDVVVRADAAVVAAEPSSDFSWRAALAGAFVTSLVIFFLLFVGAGVGLSLVNINDAAVESAATVVRFSAFYFLFALAFGGACGGYVAGRLMGPVFETTREIRFQSFTHGVLAWAVAVIATATMLAISGLSLTGAGLNAVASVAAAASPDRATFADANTRGYWVDTLFRHATAPAAPAAQTPAAPQPGVAPAPTAPETAARAGDSPRRTEANRILAVGLARGATLGQPDRQQLAALVAEETGMSQAEATRRVDEVLTRIRDAATAAAEAARKTARLLSLWLAASLLIGALTAAAGAVMGRAVDDEARDLA